MITINNNIITIKEARKILGNIESKYSDIQIKELISIFSLISDLSIDSYLRNKQSSVKSISL